MAHHRGTASENIRDHSLASLALIVITLAIYLPALWFNGHAYEDPYARSEQWFWGQHMSSLGLHMASGLLLYRVAVELGYRYAWVAAAIVLWHPIQVEGVVYAAMQPHLMVLVCTLLATVMALPLACHLRWWRVLAVLVLAYIAHEARPTGALLLPLVTAVVLSRSKFQWSLVSRWRWVLVLFVLAGSALAWKMASREAVLLVFWRESSIDRWTWAGVQLRALGIHGWHFLFPLGNQFAPIHEAMARPVGPFGLIATLALTAGAIIGAWGTRWLPWLVWIVLAMAPRLLFRETVEPLAEHHLYFVVVGVAMLIALGLEKVHDSRRA